MEKMLHRICMLIVILLELAKKLSHHYKSLHVYPNRISFINFIIKFYFLNLVYFFVTEIIVSIIIENQVRQPLKIQKKNTRIVLIKYL